MSSKDRDDDTEGSVRLDKWLWAARFFKTRSQATAAVNGGKVQVNGGRSKAGRGIHAGDSLTISKAGMTFDIVVRELAEKRGPAPQAQQLYCETEESISTRTRQQAQQRAARLATPIPEHRPDKRDRRRLQQFKQGGR